MWLYIHNARKVSQLASFKKKPCWITEGKNLMSDDSAYTHSVWPISIYNHIMNEDSIRKDSDFFCHLWINFQAENLVRQESVGLGSSSQADFRMSCFSVGNCFPSFLPSMFSPSFIFFLIKSCPFVLTPFLSCLQIRRSSADLSLVTSSWLVCRPLCQWQWSVFSWTDTSARQQ